MWIKISVRVIVSRNLLSRASRFVWIKMALVRAFMRPALVTSFALRVD